MFNNSNTVSYPAKLTQKDNGTYSITFRDVPEAIGCCDKIEDAIDTAVYTLSTTFEYYREYVRLIPAPSPALIDEVLITVKRP